jgi:hypothetical protein
MTLTIITKTNDNIDHDHTKWMITLTVITLSVFHCTKVWPSVSSTMLGTRKVLLENIRRWKFLPSTWSGRSRSRRSGTRQLLRKLASAGSRCWLPRFRQLLSVKENAQPTVICQGKPSIICQTNQKFHSYLCDLYRHHIKYHVWKLHQFRSFQVRCNAKSLLEKWLLHLGNYKRLPS